MKLDFQLSACATRPIRRKKEEKEKKEKPENNLSLDALPLISR